ncbi:MAG: phosphoribosylformylglycinamidine synthase subunit PurS [bacterium]
MFNAKITVRMKKGLLDPQGTAIGGALKSLGYSQVKEVRVGKFIEVTMDVKSKAEAEKKAEEMCRKLLANPVIEVFSCEIEEL